MIGNSIKSCWKYLYFHPKSFKITSKPNSYLMPICGRGSVNTSTHTFCNIDLTHQMAYAYYENIIRNLERLFELFWKTIWSLCGWFICFWSSYSLDCNESGSKLSELFKSMCKELSFGILQTILTIKYLL